MNIESNPGYDAYTHATKLNFHSSTHNFFFVVFISTKKKIAKREQPTKQSILFFTNADHAQHDYPWRDGKKGFFYFPFVFVFAIV
jgi:hypothetical protein